MSTNTVRERPRLVVAGATGFIGQSLPRALRDRFYLIGLSRRSVNEPGQYDEFRQADLFSLKDTERALEGADVAVYLVHSMLPSARLVQASFDDLDAVCADNFARAAETSGIRHIIYLGGLMPDGPASSHLASRAEVEVLLGSRGASVTALRAGLVIGASGSSFQMLVRLVRRLPVMVCPAWTATLTQPVGENTIVAAIAAVCERPELRSKVYDVACEEQLSYRDLMARTSTALGLRRHFLSVPFFSPGFSRLWVSVVTGAPRALVKPLVASLRYPMLARPNHRLPLQINQTVADMLECATQQRDKMAQNPRAFTAVRCRRGPHTVRSVQRMSLPQGADARWAAEEYLRWLPIGLKGIIRVEQHDGDELCFRVFRRGPVLLRLQPRRHRSESSRQVLRVTGGLLARSTERGRLEFRQILDGRTLIAAIHDFVPSLPWWIYRATQAVFHRWVMARFAKHLKQVGDQGRLGTETVLRPSEAAHFPLNDGPVIQHQE
ncbi:MAG: NAD-dependent epimerase/dehydratase family protein [Bradymonadia bacterium]